MTAGQIHPPLAAALREIVARIPVERIDTLWIFPPRSVGGSSSAVAVLSLFDEQDPAGRREVVTLMTSGATGGKEARPASTFADHGSVPADRVERLVLGVVHRLKDERETPLIEPIAGDPARWATLFAEPHATG